MALIKCPECLQNVSDKAASCPQCGFPFAQKTEQSLPETVQCLECKKIFPFDDHVCPHCGLFNSQKYALLEASKSLAAEPRRSEVTTVSKQLPSPKKWYQTWKGLLLVFFVLGIFGNAFNDRSAKPPPSPQEIAAKQEENDSIDARTYAKMYVEKTLKAPSTAKWPNVLDFGVAPKKDKKGKRIKDIWEVSGYVDAQNSFAAMIRTNWYVQLQKVGSSWVLLDIKSW
ncbi:MAG: zinc ribbon domain-containing protein [Geobacter sp.]|nr:MAG: zinc ribbon domain-containing protein [Geobacter sp.]